MTFNLNDYVSGRLAALFPNWHHQNNAGLIPPGANNYVPPSPGTRPSPSPSGGGAGGFNWGGAGSGYGTANNNPYNTGSSTVSGNNASVSGTPYISDWSISPQDSPNMDMSGMASFATGGMVANSGPVRPGQPIPQDQGQGQPPVQMPQMAQMTQAPQSPQDPNQVQAQLQQAIQSNPQKVQSVKMAIKGLLDSGNMTEQQLSAIVQLAKVALHNPSAWPQLRAYAIKEGLGNEQEIPQQYDAGLVYSIILAGMALQDSQPGSQQTPDNQPQAPAGLMPSMAKGGLPGKSMNADGSIVAKLHENEYVMPKHAVLYHGKKHLDKLVEQATYPNGKPQENKSGR